MKDEDFVLKFNSIFPMIRILHIEDVLYVYDAKSNFLSEISEEELNLIYNFYINNNDDLILPDYLQAVIRKNVFSPGEMLKLTPSVEETTALVEFELKNQLPRKFTLEVTEECTLRCKYCFYTTEDKNKRKHSYSKMQEKTAYKAIDLYFSRYTSLISHYLSAMLNQG